MGSSLFLEREIVPDKIITPEDLEKMGISVHTGKRIMARPKPVIGERNRKILDRWLPAWSVNLVQTWSIIRHHEGIGKLKELFPNSNRRTAVIVGIGASLDKNIEELKGINAIIIATDFALRPLVARGIRPDIVINFDGGWNIWKAFRDVDTKDMLLVTTTTTHYTTLDAWQGAFLFFNMGHPGLDFFDIVLPAIYPKFPSLPNLGCVGNVGVLLANFMGCSPILLVGCDLAYTKGRYRCRDFRKKNGKWKPIHTIKQDKIRVKERAIRDPKTGMLIETSFLTYREGLMKVIKAWNLNVINCTEGGIIKDIPCMPLKEAKERYC